MGSDCQRCILPLHYCIIVFTDGILYFPTALYIEYRTSEIVYIGFLLYETDMNDMVGRVWPKHWYAWHHGSYVSAPNT